MITLRIDTTDRAQVVVELVKDGELIDVLQQTAPFGSQVLLPSIEQLLTKNKLGVYDITKVEVNRGPGSYTGTRIGVAVANTISWALGLRDTKQLDQPIYQNDQYNGKT